MIALGFIAAGGLSLVVGSGGYSVVAAHGLIIMVSSLVSEHGLWEAGDSTAHRLSCSEARGTFLGQGLNQCLLHW